MPAALEEDAKPTPFRDLAGAVAVILADPLGVVAIIIARAYPAAHIIGMRKKPPRFGYDSFSAARRAGFAIPSILVSVRIPAITPQATARQIAAAR